MFGYFFTSGEYQSYVCFPLVNNGGMRHGPLKLPLMDEVEQIDNASGILS
jgi:hypothetical protein